MWSWLRRETDHRAVLLKELQHLDIQWPDFREHALKVLSALQISVPCQMFSRSPSPESFVDQMEALYQKDSNAAHEFKALLSLAALEHAIMGV